MVVAIPPMITAKFIGISIFDVEPPARSARPITTGIRMTTTGVSLMTMLRPIATASSASMAIKWLNAHSRARTRATGSSAPVTMSARPRIIRLQIATRASCPNAEKIWPTPIDPCSPLYGNR